MVEPACWSWTVPPLRDLEAEIVRLVADHAALGPDDELPREVIAEELSLNGMDEHRFLEFHIGTLVPAGDVVPVRCALCGRLPIGYGHSTDHDHATGLVRGFLCHGCNVAEGLGRREVGRLYRQRNPATILGLRRYYTGRGWPHGWWENIHHAVALTGNPDWAPIEGATC